MVFPEISLDRPAQSLSMRAQIERQLACAGRKLVSKA